MSTLIDIFRENESLPNDCIKIEKKIKHEIKVCQMVILCILGLKISLSSVWDECFLEWKTFPSYIW